MRRGTSRDMNGDGLTQIGEPTHQAALGGKGALLAVYGLSEARRDRAARELRMALTAGVRLEVRLVAQAPRAAAARAEGPDEQPSGRKTRGCPFRRFGPPDGNSTQLSTKNSKVGTPRDGGQRCDVFPWG